MNYKTVLDVNQIKKLLPHRYPFLLVDKVIEITEDSITAIKNVTANEEFFNGHFPESPVMPGVLMVEALAQVGGIFGFQKAENQNGIAYFAGVDGVKWKKPVVPGDQLKLEVKVTKLRLPLIVCEGKASVDGETVCEVASLKMMLAPKG